MATSTTRPRARYGIVLPPWFSPAAAVVCILLAIVYPFRRLGRPAAWFSVLCAAGAFASAVMAWRIQSVAMDVLYADRLRDS